MAYYYEDVQPERAAPYSNGGCLSGFIMIPIAVIAVSAVLFFTLCKITTVSSAAQPQVEQGLGGNFLGEFRPPYDTYTLTQGLHGISYGHLAIDIAAGKDAVIYSPIHGKVTELFKDGIGNPVLVIENDKFRVTMLHGEYSVQIGQNLRAGQPIGTESNLGNTTDMQGRSCRDRDCGYHTHLNVFDKHIGANTNPLDLLKP